MLISKTHELLNIIKWLEIANSSSTRSLPNSKSIIEYFSNPIFQAYESDICYILQNYIATKLMFVKLSNKKIE